MIYYNPKIIINDLGLKGKGKEEPFTHGDWLLCLCPYPHFKKSRGKYFEKNPSLAINLKGGNFKCFTCDTSGKLEDLAATLGKRLSSKAYIKIASLPDYSKSTKLYATLKMLTVNREEGLAYLKERNILLPPTTNVGKALNSVYFPILNSSGELVAWNTRNLNSESRWEKHPNGFDFGKILYGEEDGKAADGFLVESIIDRLYLKSLGVPALSTLGNLFTDYQAERVITYFRNVTLIVQNDLTGLTWFYFTVKKLLGRIPLYLIKIPQKYKDLNEMPLNELKDLISSQRINLSTSPEIKEFINSYYRRNKPLE